MTSAISSTVQWWAGTYADHAAVRTAVAFTHLGGLLAAGGCALAADYATLVLPVHDPATYERHLQTIRRTHTIVAVGLFLLFASGLLLLAADLDTYGTSRLFWLKMAFIAALLINGAGLTRLERRAQADAQDWQKLRRASIVSASLWLLTTLLGAALPNIG